MIYLFFQVHKPDIFLIKFILESYENLMTLTTVDPERGKIQVTVAPDFYEDCLAIIESLKDDFQLVQLDEPKDVSQGSY